MSWGQLESVRHVLYYVLFSLQQLYSNVPITACDERSTTASSRTNRSMFSNTFPSCLLDVWLTFHTSSPSKRTFIYSTKPVLSTATAWLLSSTKHSALYWRVHYMKVNIFLYLCVLPHTPLCWPTYYNSAQNYHFETAQLFHFWFQIYS